MLWDWQAFAITPNATGARERSAQMDQRLEGFSVPADGTSAATEGNGDFGTSPFIGQLLDKPRLAYNSQLVPPHLEHNSGSREN